MENCILCGGPTKFVSNDFCEVCFNSSIEELMERYEKKRASVTGKDHEETRAERICRDLQG